MSEQGEREKLTDEQWARFLEHRGLVEMVASEMMPKLGGRFTFKDALALGEDGVYFSGGLDLFALDDSRSTSRRIASPVPAPKVP